MEYVLGIDSGGTNYRVAVAHLDGGIIASTIGKPANPHYLDQETLKVRISQNIEDCLKVAGASKEEIRYIVCGTTGIDSEEDACYVQSCYASLPGFCCPIKVINDAELAHYTVTEGKGVLLISGTGSIAFGVNREGRKARAGGWPLSILGDEGSGLWVTKRALRHLGRWLDGAVEDTPLVSHIRKETGICTREDLNRIALAGGMGQTGLPQLGKLVNQSAAEGDSYADNILKEASRELYGIVCDVVKALDLECNEPDFKLGIWGSNILKSPRVLAYFEKQVKQTFRQAEICLPEREAIEGAIDMAQKLLRMEYGS